VRNKTFTILLLVVVGVCVLLTLAHLAYAVDAYQHCSIIEFIAKELW